MVVCRRLVCGVRGEDVQGKICYIPLTDTNPIVSKHRVIHADLSSGINALNWSVLLEIEIDERPNCLMIIVAYQETRTTRYYKSLLIDRVVENFVQSNNTNTLQDVIFHPDSWPMQ